MGRILSAAIAMNKLISLIAAAAALFACTEQFVSEETNYYIDDSGSYLFTATVEGLSGEWIWDAASCKVGVYAGDTENAVFVPRAVFDGKTGQAGLIGPAVHGQAYAYIPFRIYGYAPAEEGCMALPSEQQYFTDAVAHIEGNTPVLVAAADSAGHLAFRYPCGALHLTVKIHFSENVQRLTLTAAEPVCGLLNVSNGTITGGANMVSVTGIDLPCTESAPLDVWVMLPEGTFTGIYITASGNTESISTVLEEEVSIVAGAEVHATVQEKKNNYGASDFEGEEVDYD